MTARELWERAGYLRASAFASAAYADYVDADAAYSAADAYAATIAAYDAYAIADAVAAFDAGMARWAREHPPQIEAEP